MATAKIVFASMTGNTEEIAGLVEESLKENGVDVEVHECTEVHPTDFQNADIAVIASYTYGEGELPDEIVDFHDGLADVDLSGKVYGVIGSGDTSYDDLFCKAVDDFDEVFAKTGAKKGADNVKIEFEANDEDKEKIKLFAKDLVSKL
jgi:flavodoxin short chain